MLNINKLSLKESGKMESIVKKCLSSLVVFMMLFTLTMPVLVQATEAEGAPKYTVADMKLNTIIYFEGQTYSALHYKCNNDKYKKEVYTEKTAGIVWKLNKKYDSIVVQLSDGKFRTVPVSQVLDIRAEKFINLDASTLDELKNGQLKLNITILGEKNKVNISNSSVVSIGKDGMLSLGIDNGFSQVTFDIEGREEPIVIDILKDASGHVALDIENLALTADAKATLLNALTTGGSVEFSAKDGVIKVGGAVSASGAQSGTAYIDASGALSYDINAGEDADIMADVNVSILDNPVVPQTNIDTHIVKTIKSLISRIAERIFGR